MEAIKLDEQSVKEAIAVSLIYGSFLQDWLPPLSELSFLIQTNSSFLINFFHWLHKFALPLSASSVICSRM